MPWFIFTPSVLVISLLFVAEMIPGDELAQSVYFFSIL